MKSYKVIRNYKYAIIDYIPESFNLQVLKCAEKLYIVIDDENTNVYKTETKSHKAAIEEYIDYCIGVLECIENREKLVTSASEQYNIEEVPCHWELLEP